MASLTRPNSYYAATAPEQGNGVSRARRWVGMCMLGAVVALLYLIETHRVEYFQINSESMLPTLQVGETYLMLPAKTFQRGQIVVFPNPTERSTLLVKRLVALEGDEVQVREGLLYVNGALNDPPQGRGTAIDLPDREWRLQSGEAFVAGDNRNNSRDSRDFGPLAKQDLRGVLNQKARGRPWWRKGIGK